MLSFRSPYGGGKRMFTHRHVHSLAGVIHINKAVDSKLIKVSSSLFEHVLGNKRHSRGHEFIFEDLAYNFQTSNTLNTSYEFTGGKEGKVG